MQRKKILHVQLDLQWMKPVRNYYWRVKKRVGEGGRRDVIDAAKEIGSMLEDAEGRSKKK